MCELYFSEAIRLDLRNSVGNNCTATSGGGATPTPLYAPWPPLLLEGVHNFSAAIGPTGGDRGYAAITSELLFLDEIFFFLQDYFYFRQDLFLF